MKAPSQQVAKAVQDGIAVLEDILRLDEILTTHGTLTKPQQQDRDSAIRRYNETRSVIDYLPAYDDADDFIDRAARAYKVAKQEVEGDQLRSLVEARIGPTTSSDSGNAHGDEIRAMLDSGERIRDFDLVGAFEKRAIADFSDNASLYASDFAGRVAMYLRTESPWFKVATVVRADNGRPLVVPDLTADPTTYSPGEGTAITESTPTLGTAQVTLTSYKTLSYVSQESMEDVEYDLAAVLAKSAARSISLSFGSAATATILSGINNGGTASGVGGTGTSTTTYVGYEDLIDLEMSRAAPYRAAGSWVMSNGAIKKVRKYRDGQGNYLWPSENLAAGQPASFEGHSVYEDPYLAAVGSASKSFIFGDLASALVIKATNLRVAVSPDFKFSNDQIALKVVLRAGIAVQDPAAAAFLVSANS